MKRLYLLLSALLLALAPVTAQDLTVLGRYDETNGGFQGHATQILQDKYGMIWIATWNGLCRFDGYEFRQLKPQAGDGCTMVTDRLRDIWLADNDDIYCRTDEGDYCFSKADYKFRDLKDSQEQQRAEQLRLDQTNRGNYVDGNIDYIDPQGLLWRLHNDVLYCLSRIEQPTQSLPIQPAAAVRCVAQDGKHRIWLATKDDGAVRLFDPQTNLIGFLSPSGKLSQAYTSFGHAIYCMLQTRNGTIWMGSKPDGLFRLKEVAEGNFRVEHIDGLADNNVYDIVEDAQGRLWIATLGGGIACIEQPDADVPRVENTLRGYPKDHGQRVRDLLISSHGTLLAGTTDGLLVAQIQSDVQAMRFRRHGKEPLRPTSLSCSAVMDVLQDPQGHLYVSTETGGINEVVSADLLADTLSFVRYNQQWGLPTDMMVSMALAGNKLLAVSNTQFMLIDTYAHTVESFGPHFFHETHRFSEARPLKLDNTRWLMPTQQGAFLLSEQLMRKSSYSPQLVLTGISIQNREQNLAVVSLDTLVLNPQERNLTIHFAALDYSDPHAVQYQFRLGDESTAWNNIGHNHSVTLLDLQPGTYRLTIRSTNADGLWVGNERSLLIIAQPRFVETTLARVLLLLLLLAVVAFSVYTYLYIRRIKRQRQETLQAYLELLNASAAHSEQRETSAASDPGASKWGVKEVDDNPFVWRLLDYVEQNLSDSDADIGQMAEACAVSRSVLQRKVKQLLGVTPIDFIREARMKHACHLLQTTDETIAEVAYHCGFSDPKYFSRCFKQSVGQSPSDYKAGLASS